MATSPKIDDTLKNREEARQSFKQEALASWAAYQATGRHVTGQEVRAWLDTWGTNEERPVPECHGSSLPMARQVPLITSGL